MGIVHVTMLCGIRGAFAIKSHKEGLCLCVFSEKSVIVFTFLGSTKSCDARGKRRTKLLEEKGPENGCFLNSFLPVFFQIPVRVEIGFVVVRDYVDLSNFRKS